MREGRGGRGVKERYKSEAVLRGVGDDAIRVAIGGDGGVSASVMKPKEKEVFREEAREEM